MVVVRHPHHIETSGEKIDEKGFPSPCCVLYFVRFVSR